MNKLLPAIIIPIIAAIVLSSCGDGSQSAEAAYVAAAQKAVERAKSLKKNGDVAVAKADKAAMKQVADELELQYVFLQDLTPPTQLVEFHTTVVQHVSVVFETAEQIVVQDLPPQEAQSAWEEVTAEWDIWVEQVWNPWVEEVARIEEPPPEVSNIEEPSPGPTVEAAEIEDFDGDYLGEATLSVTAEGTALGPITVPFTFSVADGEIEGYYTDGESEGYYTGFILDPSGSAEVTIDMSQFGVAGSITANVAFLRSPAADDVSVEGTITGSFSVEDATVVVDGTITADRV